MNAQISFIDGQFSLIHIPLPLYFSLLQPIIQVLLPCEFSKAGNKPDAGDLSEGLPIEDKHGFLNISVTPIEASIVCHVSLARTIFQPAIGKLPPDASKLVSVSRESYMVFSVSSAGMEAGQRVIDLTAPLAMAGISIFFITTYYTDFILVPSKDNQTVVKALLARGFEFSEIDSAFVAPTPSHSRAASSISDPPSTPPPSNIAELQTRTFDQLKRRNVVPFTLDMLHLAQCSGKEYNTSSEDFHQLHSKSSGSHPSGGHWLETIDSKLYLSLIAALTLRPHFLSITLSKDDAPSLLIEKNLLPMFSDSIAGDTEGDLVPIFLDLSNMPLESTGIVCGVAGKLVEDLRTQGLEGFELSYLGTARAGAVILSSEIAVKALSALKPSFQ